jgi:hypothetical protein
MHKLFRMGTGSIVLALLLLTGCNLPSRVNPPASELALTMAAETIEAQMTLNAQALPTSGAAPTATTDPLLTENPQFTIAPTNTPGPSLTPTEEPCDAAGFDKDVTVPDGTEMTPGEEFTKTWRVINEGTCTWNSGYSLVFDDGDAMGAPASIQITSGTVSRGTKLDISIDLTAPSTPGTYRGVWQLRNDSGAIFTIEGIWVEIKVVEPDVFSSDTSFEITQGAQADLDDGSSPPSDIEDFEFTAPSNDNKTLVPLNGAKFLAMGEDEPTYAECNEAALKSEEIKISSGLVGDWVCFITNEDRLGKFEVLTLTPADISVAQTLEIDYITWKAP